MLGNDFADIKSLTHSHTRKVTMYIVDDEYDNSDKPRATRFRIYSIRNNLFRYCICVSFSRLACVFGRVRDVRTTSIFLMSKK